MLSTVPLPFLLALFLSLPLSPSTSTPSETHKTSPYYVRVSVKFLKSYAARDEVSSELDYHSCHAMSDCWNSDPEYRLKIVCALGKDGTETETGTDGRNATSGKVRSIALHCVACDAVVMGMLGVLFTRIL